jgi:hypothetical protein
MVARRSAAGAGTFGCFRAPLPVAGRHSRSAIAARIFRGERRTLQTTIRQRLHVKNNIVRSFPTDGDDARDANTGESRPRRSECPGGRSTLSLAARGSIGRTIRRRL